jgi:predicted CopG family antitoxin
MKTLNIPLEDSDYEKLSKLKGEKISWREFLLLMYVHCIDSQKRGDFEVEK